MTSESALETMSRVNQLWLSGQVDALSPMVHPDVTMVFPNFAGRVQGRAEFLSGFREFCSTASIEQFREFDQQCHTAEGTAVVTFRYEMVYARAGERYQASGRDLWVFANVEGKWIAVWRAMLDVEEKPE